MKRIIVFYALTTTVFAMKDTRQPRLIQAIRPMIISILTKKESLSTEELEQAKKLIKEARAQSPAQGLEYQDELDTKIAIDSINTEGFRAPHNPLNIARTPSRTPSPLSIPCTN